MRLYLLIAIFSVTLFSCDQQPQKTTSSKTDFLSSWFTKYEDSLYNSFIDSVNFTSLCYTCDTVWGEKAFQWTDSNSFMGRFSLEAKKYCDSIEVTYFYNKSTSPKIRILLSVNYNRNYIKALDTILNFISPKYFKVDKYEQPDLTTDIFGLDNGDVIIKDIRAEVKPTGNLYNVRLFIRAKPKDTVISEENKDYLKHQLFGEELLLKKINNVEFRFSDTINPNLLTLNETRQKLK